MPIANGQRVAMRVGSTLYWLLTDHLGSTAITANSSGGKYAELRYKAWGETRYTYGTTPTAYKFTGQRLDNSVGLYYYGARYYDPALGRFLQPDPLVPDPANPQALNRYAYVLNNPVRYTDPTGHAICLDEECRQRVHPITLTPIGGWDKWWINVTPPSIRTVRAGGAYGYGEIQYGPETVSLYRPPTVWWFPGNPDYYPRYDPNDPTIVILPAGSFVADYWIGEEYPSAGNAGIQDPVTPGTWERVDVKWSVEGPSREEALIGAFAGILNSPESLPPGPGAPRAELQTELIAQGFYALSGALQAGRENVFVLQRDAEGNYRLIVLTRQFSSEQSFYVTAKGFSPVVCGPVTIRRR